MSERTPEPNNPELEIIRDRRYQMACMDLLADSLRLSASAEAEQEEQRPDTDQNGVAIELLPDPEEYPIYSAVCISVHPGSEVSDDSDLMVTIRIYEDLYGDYDSEPQENELCHEYRLSFIEDKYCLQRERILINYSGSNDVELDGPQVVGISEIEALIRLLGESSIGEIFKD